MRARKNQFVPDSILRCCRFRSWMKKGKSWMTDMNQVQVHLPQQQVSVTIYGAIGSTLQGPLFMIGEC